VAYTAGGANYHTTWLPSGQHGRLKVSDRYSRRLRSILTLPYSNKSVQESSYACAIVLCFFSNLFLLTLFTFSSLQLSMWDSSVRDREARGGTTDVVVHHVRSASAWVYRQNSPED